MKNNYIERDRNENIIGLFARPQYVGQEKLPEDDPEIVSFLEEQLVPTEAELNEQKIAAEIRLQAIESLKAKGDLPADFTG